MNDRRPSRLVLLLALATMLIWFVPIAVVQAAAPGETIVTANGTLPAGNTRLVSIFDSGDANIRLRVTGASSADTVTFTIRSGTAPIASWVVRRGETTWGHLTIPAGATLEILNTSATAQTYDAQIYARDILPSIAEGLSDWSGVSASTGTQSAAQFTVNNPGLYRFTTGATSGSFQLTVNDTYLVKTVAQGVALDPADSTYYLPAGVHTFKIIQNPGAPETSWQIGIEAVGGVDSLPFSESTGVLGTGFFPNERIPIQIAADQSVNLQIAATGAASDQLTVELYNGETLVATSDPIFGGEVAWLPSQIIAGANALRVAAAGGNAGTLAYAITLDTVGAVPTTWTGTSYGAPAHPSGGNSKLNLTFPADGLYQFSLSSTAGRYQFLLDNQYLQRTAASSGATSFTAFVAAGNHELTIRQDPSVASTAWSVDITATDTANDSLTHTRISNSFGAATDSFREEWLPIQMAGSQAVNVRISVTGALSDSVLFELYNGTTAVHTVTSVYGGEVLWQTTSLATGSNRLHIVADSANTGPISYTVDVVEITNIPLSWQGMADGSGSNSTITVNALTTGVYTLTLTIAEGAGVILVDQPTIASSAATPLAGSTTVVRVPLQAGTHRITFQQAADEPRTAWKVEMQERPAGAWQISLPLVVR